MIHVLTKQTIDKLTYRVKETLINNRLIVKTREINKLRNNITKISERHKPIKNI